MMRGRICDPEVSRFNGIKFGFVQETDEIISVQTGLDVVPGEQGEMLLQGPSESPLHNPPSLFSLVSSFAN